MNISSNLKKVGELRRNDRSKAISMILALTIGIIMILFFPVIKRLGIIYVKKEDLFKFIIMLYVLIIGTFVLHESIHVVLFKLFRSDAVIRIESHKELGAIVVRQTNPNVFYTCIEMMIILLSPFLLITVVSIPFLFIHKFALISYINCAINAMASSIDIYISYRIIRYYSMSNKIQFSTEKEPAMVIYKDVLKYKTKEED